jgi:hypothetical protein
VKSCDTERHFHSQLPGNCLRYESVRGLTVRNANGIIDFVWSAASTCTRSYNLCSLQWRQILSSITAPLPCHDDDAQTRLQVDTFCCLPSRLFSWGFRLWAFGLISLSAWSQRDIFLCPRGQWVSLARGRGHDANGGFSRCSSDENEARRSCFKTAGSHSHHNIPRTLLINEHNAWLAGSTYKRAQNSCILAVKILYTNDTYSLLKLMSPACTLIHKRYGQETWLQHFSNKIGTFWCYLNLQFISISRSIDINSWSYEQINGHYCANADHSGRTD